MSKTTTNYGLIIPELTDVADITATNENWNKIDAELKKKYDSTNKPTATDIGADASGSAAKALSDAKSYTDQKIATIPTPDVSGQINAHNTDSSAHSDIRALATEKEIFKARYGTTKSADIEAAYQAGKFCICVSADGKVVYTLYDRVVATQHFFFDPKAGVVSCKNDVWAVEKTAAQLIGSPTVSEMNAAIAAIPTPDVSGQIGTHNSSSTAHNDIRQLIANKKGAVVYTATIGTSWTENETTGVKSQNVAINGVTANNTAKVDHIYTGNGSSESYATFVTEENQYLECITNGYAETYNGGIAFHIFGDANTVNIPIVVEVV